MPAPMPIAASTIAAQAFRFMEKSPISSFDDGSEEAQAAKEQYPSALAQCLEAADWSFASRIVFLPPADLPETWEADPELPNLYALPGDLAMIRQVGNGQTAWRRDQNYIWADQPARLRLRYTMFPTNEAALPATFQLAVSLTLAGMLAPRWMPTANKIAALEERAMRSLKTAMRHDARMASPMRYDGGTSQGDWVTEARL